jgi:putative alpha-1,2-mannosidase
VKLAVALLVALLMAQEPMEAEAQPAPVYDALTHAARVNGLREQFLFCLAREESGFDPSATSPYGHQGLFQFSPDTWEDQAPRFRFGGFSPYHGWANAHVAAGRIRELAAAGDFAELSRQWPPYTRCGTIWAPAPTPTATPTPYNDLGLG